MAYPRARVGGSGGGDGEFELPKIKPTAFVIGHAASIGWQGGGTYEPRPQIVLAYELAQTDSQGRRFISFSPYTNSVNKKANLRKIVDALDPGAVPEDAAADFDYDLGRLIGKMGFASILLTENKGKKYASIGTVMELPEGMPSMQPKGNYDRPFGFWKYLDGKQMDEHEALDIIKTMREKAAHEKKAKEEQAAEIEVPPADESSVPHDPENVLSEPEPFEDPVTGETRF